MVAANDMARSPSPDPPRPGERETTAAGHCTPRLRTCAYASELLFYLISAAAATLSRRLARATLYSLLPSRSGCAPPLPPCPSTSPSRAYTHTSSLSLHLLYFVFPPLSVSQSRSLLFLSFFLTPLFLLSSSSVPFFPISLFCHILLFPRSSFFPQHLFLCPPVYRSFPRTPRLSMAYLSAPRRHQHSLFKISADIKSNLNSNKL